jgi:hypothetical protein
VSQVLEHLLIHPGLNQLHPSPPLSSIEHLPPAPIRFSQRACARF